jgi:hypothetical protein
LSERFGCHLIRHGDVREAAVERGGIRQTQRRIEELQRELEVWREKLAFDPNARALYRFKEGKCYVEGRRIQRGELVELTASQALAPLRISLNRLVRCEGTAPWGGEWWPCNRCPSPRRPTGCTLAGKWNHSTGSGASPASAGAGPQTDSGTRVYDFAVQYWMCFVRTAAWRNLVRYQEPRPTQNAPLSKTAAIPL